MDTVIIILNWNGWEDTRQLVLSLVENKIAAPIWVVDNASKLDKSQVIREINSEVKIYRLTENYGFAGGMNRAIRLAANVGFRMVYAINNDCLINSDFLTPSVKAAISFPEISILGSRYLSRDNQNEYSIWGFHSDPKEMDNFKNGVLLADRVVGCGMLIKIDHFHEVSGFNEEFFCYGEENDLSRRLQKKGYRVGICYDSLILHNHQGSDIGGNSIYYRTRNAYLLKVLHPDMNNCMSDPLDIINRAYKNIKNYEVFSSYIEGLYCGRSGVFGKRNKFYPQSTVYLLFIYYYLLFFPYRIYIFIKRIITRIINIFSKNSARYLYRRK